MGDLIPTTPLWTIHTDRVITRRKLYHIVGDPEGRVAFRAKRLSDCLAFLLEREVTEARLDCPEMPPLIMSLSRSDQKDT